MSLATSHLHTARLWASSPRVFEHFIHSLNPEHRLPETSECLGMQSCSKTWQEGSLSFTPSEWLQRKWPHQAVSVLAFSQKCSLPGQQSCPVCIHRTLLLVPTWVPAVSQMLLGVLALVSNEVFMGPRRNEQGK